MGTKITIELPDELHAAVRGAGLDPTNICRVALEESLEHSARAALAVAPAAGAVGDGREDDHSRHRRGYDLGRAWAFDWATPREIAEVAVWSREPWRQFSLKPEQNSLPDRLCAERGWPRPAHGSTFWIERDAFTMGLVEGVASMARQDAAAR